MSIDIAGQLADLRRQIHDLQGLETLAFQKITAYTPTYLGETTAGVTTYAANGQVGHWAQIEKLVFFWGRVEWTNATGTGNAIISMPATSANVTNLNYSGGLDTTAVTFANGTPVMIIGANLAFFRMRSPLTNAATATVQVEAAGAVNFSGFFEVT